MAGEDTELLSQTARRTRRMLLVIAPLTLLLGAFPEFRPTGIPALGIECEGGGCDAMLIFGSLFLVNIYLVVSFVWCALRDFQHAGAPELGVTFRGHWERRLIARSCENWLRFGGKYNQSEPLWQILEQIRLQTGTDYPKFLVVVAWAFLRQAKRTIVDRIVVFWVLEFWFPLLIGFFALTGNAESAYHLVIRVFDAI